MMRNFALAVGGQQDLGQFWVSENRGGGNEAVSDGKTEELNFRKCMDGIQFRDILNVPLGRNKA